MKQFTKKIALALLVLIGSTFIFSDLSIANAEVTDTNETVVATALPSDDNSAIAPCADVIGWRYKTINGKLYRRKYNYTQEKWIESWELVP